MLFLFKIVILCVFLICCYECSESDKPKYEVAKGNFGHIIKGNFFFAYQYCRSIGRKLASPNTKEKSEAFVQYLKQSSIDTTWVSANDLSEEGVFHWMVDGTLLTYVDWHKGNPSNTDGNENCVEIRKELNWEWNDNNCSILYPVVCEVEPIKLPQAINCCMKGF